MIIFIEIMRRFMQDRVPRRVFYGLWMLTAARMLIPFSIPFGYSLFSVLQALGVPVGGMIGAGSGAGAGIAEGAGDLAAHGYIHYTMILKFVWIAGALAFAAYFVITYFKNIYKFKESLPVSGDIADEWAARIGVRRKVSVRESDYINSPLTYGIVRPVILMPAGAVDMIEDEQLGYIFAHELVHIKRFDSLAKIFVTAAVCVNWFDPFAWAMYALVNRDIELSCDEAVIRKVGSASRSDYAMTLVRFAELKEMSLFCFNSFGKSVLTERVNAVMTKKKTGALSLAGGIALCMIVAGIAAVSSDMGSAGALPDGGSGAAVGADIVGLNAAGSAADNAELAAAGAAAPSGPAAPTGAQSPTIRTARVSKNAASATGTRGAGAGSRENAAAAPSQTAPPANEDIYASSSNMTQTGADGTYGDNSNENGQNDALIWETNNGGPTQSGASGSGGTTSASPENLSTGSGSAGNS